MKHREAPIRNPDASLSFRLRGTGADTSAAGRHGSAFPVEIADNAALLREATRAGKYHYRVRRSTAGLDHMACKSALEARSGHT